jgi:hypothetical protein
MEADEGTLLLAVITLAMTAVGSSPTRDSRRIDRVNRRLAA